MALFSDGHHDYSHLTIETTSHHARALNFFQQFQVNITVIVANLSFYEIENGTFCMFKNVSVRLLQRFSVFCFKLKDVIFSIHGNCVQKDFENTCTLQYSKYRAPRH